MKARGHIALQHQHALLLHQAKLQHFGLNRDAGRISFRARRLLPPAPRNRK
jgi:hypothetical protein